MIEWLWVPLAIVILVAVFLLQARIDSRLQIGWLRPPHNTRIQEENASPLELAVIDWIASFQGANKTYPTYEAIMERSRQMDPDGVGIDLPAAMACYRTVKDGKADQLKLAVIEWVKDFYVANISFPTYQAIMERSIEIDPDGVGINLITAMACSRAAKESLGNTP